MFQFPLAFANPIVNTPQRTSLPPAISYSPQQTYTKLDTPPTRYARPPPRNPDCHFCSKFGRNATACAHNKVYPNVRLSVLTQLSTGLKPLTFSGRMLVKKLSFLVDIGAAVSICNEQILRRSRLILSTFPQIHVVAANNSHLTISGSATIPVILNGRTFYHHFCVSTGIKWDVILGCDFLRKDLRAINFSNPRGSLHLTNDKETPDLSGVDVCYP